MLFNFDKLIVYFQVLSCGFCKTAQVQVKVWWHLLFVTGSYRDDIVYKHFFFHYYYYLNLKRILCHWYLFYNWNTSRTKLAQRFQANFSRSMREETHCEKRPLFSTRGDARSSWKTCEKNTNAPYSTRARRNTPGHFTAHSLRLDTRSSRNKCYENMHAHYSVLTSSQACT